MFEIMKLTFALGLFISFLKCQENLRMLDWSSKWPISDTVILVSFSFRQENGNFWKKSFKLGNFDSFASEERIFSQDFYP